MMSNNDSHNLQALNQAPKTNVFFTEVPSKSTSINITDRLILFCNCGMNQSLATINVNKANIPTTTYMVAMDKSKCHDCPSRIIANLEFQEYNLHNIDYEDTSPENRRSLNKLQTKILAPSNKDDTKIKSSIIANQHCSNDSYNLDMWEQDVYQILIYHAKDYEHTIDLNAGGKFSMAAIVDAKVLHEEFIITYTPIIRLKVNNNAMFYKKEEIVIKLAKYPTLDQDKYQKETNISRCKKISVSFPNYKQVNSNIFIYNKDIVSLDKMSSVNKRNSVSLINNSMNAPGLCSISNSSFTSLADDITHNYDSCVLFRAPSALNAFLNTNSPYIFNGDQCAILPRQKHNEQQDFRIYDFMNHVGNVYEYIKQLSVTEHTNALIKTYLPMAQNIYDFFREVSDTSKAIKVINIFSRGKSHILPKILVFQKYAQDKDKNRYTKTIVSTKENSAGSAIIVDGFLSDTLYVIPYATGHIYTTIDYDGSEPQTKLANILSLTDNSVEEYYIRNQSHLLVSHNSQTSQTKIISIEQYPDNTVMTEESIDRFKLYNFSDYNISSAQVLSRTPVKMTKNSQVQLRSA